MDSICCTRRHSMQLAAHFVQILSCNIPLAGCLIQHWLCKTTFDHKLVLLQEAAVFLLCNMASFAFYRPAIRQAAPATAVADMLTAGCFEVIALKIACCYAAVVLCMLDASQALQQWPYTG